ncbi:STAS domain-containing protein [Dactylosporangium cerinum]|uniref:STAS domain-containing protein n=1 Tax=Dactylosporangium cerinum TaxID=1434730 RepID=A0ABV9W0K1_9ACTN
MTFSITARYPTNRSTVLVLRGVIDYDSARVLRAAISAAVARRPMPRLIVVDLQAVTSVNDVGVGTLVVAGRICQDIGISLVVRHPSPA